MCFYCCSFLVSFLLLCYVLYFVCVCLCVMLWAMLPEIKAMMMMMMMIRHTRASSLIVIDYSIMSRIVDRNTAQYPDNASPYRPIETSAYFTECTLR